MLVGYTDDAWIIQNTWGAAWGECGYVRIQRIEGKNTCGIFNEYAFAPVELEQIQTIIQ